MRCLLPWGFPETPRLNVMALLHVGRLVLNMSKYLIRLSNTSANDHQRVEDDPPAARRAFKPRPSLLVPNHQNGVPVDQNIRCLSGEQAPPVVAPLEPRDHPFGERADWLSLNASRRSRFSTRRSAGKQDS